MGAGVDQRCVPGLLLGTLYEGRPLDNPQMPDYKF
jgi:hypothetical protein